MKEEIQEPVSYAKAATAAGSLVQKDQKALTSRISSPQRKQQPRTLSIREASPQKAKVMEYSISSTAIRDLSEMTKGFRNFAAGGHLESDRKLAAMAERDDTEARQKRLDEENFAALFGGKENEVAADNKQKTKKGNDVNLVRTLDNGLGGSRGVWKGTMEVPQKKGGPSKEQEPSLLDL